MFNDGQAQAGASGFSRMAFIHPVKAFEYALLLFLRHPPSIVIVIFLWRATVWRLSTTSFFTMLWLIISAYPEIAIPISQSPSTADCIPVILQRQYNRYTVCDFCGLNRHICFFAICIFSSMPSSSINAPLVPEPSSLETTAIFSLWENYYLYLCHIFLLYRKHCRIHWHSIQRLDKIRSKRRPAYEKSINWWTFKALSESM